MSDVYTAPPSFSYLLTTPFSMPSERGDRWAVSFTGNSATLMAAALSVAITIAFLCLWNFVCFIALLFDGNKSRRRYAALVTLWNSNDSWFAFKELLSYTFESARNPQHWSDVAYGLLFCLLALSMFVGTIVMGIIGPSLVQIGNVAPVQPETLFYPATPLDDPVQLLQDFGLRAPGVMRALGSVEAARVTIRSRVSVREDTSFPDRADGDHVMGLTYDYSLSGVELGLQGGDGLTLAVEGSCFTEYGWAVDNPDETPGFELDLYELWGDSNQLAWALLNPNDIQHAPKASFHLHPLAGDQLFRDSNISYAVRVDSAWRSSISEGSDPWYATEQRPEPDTPDRYNAAWRMKRRRPILSCWEKDTWGYQGQNVTSVFDLKDLPGMKIPAILLEVLETTFSGGPMIVRLGNASGDSALRSRTTSPNGVINAQASRIYDDMERLVLASFVASRSLFTDATMFGRTSSDGGYRNLFTADDGRPAAGAGNFVVSSPNIQTFSLTGIVSLAAVLLSLLVADTLVWALVRVKTRPLASTQDATKDKWTRFHVLAAVQLFRCLYEKTAADGGVATTTTVTTEEPADAAATTTTATEKPAGVTTTTTPVNTTGKTVPTTSTVAAVADGDVDGSCWDCGMPIPNCGEFRLAPCPGAGRNCPRSGGKCLGHINRTVTCCGDRRIGSPVSPRSPV